MSVFTVLIWEHGGDKGVPEETVLREGIIWRDSFPEGGLCLCPLRVMRGAFV